MRFKKDLTGNGKERDFILNVVESKGIVLWSDILLKKKEKGPICVENGPGEAEARG